MFYSTEGIKLDPVAPRSSGFETMAFSDGKRLGRTGQSQMLRLLVIPVMGYDDVELQM